jgi:hypothetical protein
MWMWLPTTILVSLFVASALGFGIAILATAVKRRPASLSSGAWWGANSASAAWYGGVFLAAPASGFALALGMLRIHPSPHPNLLLLDLSAPAVVVAAALPTLGCLLLARLYSNRAVKRTIQAGLAPTHWVSPDLCWWWDGGQWLKTVEAVPDDAQRSPDGDHWWTGRRWIPVPRR